MKLFLKLLILNKKLSKITRSFFISIKQPTLRLWDFWYSVSADFKNEFEFDLGVEDLNTKKGTPHNKKGKAHKNKKTYFVFKLSNLHKMD